MKSHKYRFIVCLFVLFLFSGCGAGALVVGGLAVVLAPAREPIFMSTAN